MAKKKPDTRVCGAKLANVLGTCWRRATVERDGQWYCFQHDPERVERLRLERQAAEKAKWDEFHRKDELRVAHNKLLDASGVKGLTDDDLVRIAAAGGMEKLLKFCDPTPVTEERLREIGFGDNGYNYSGCMLRLGGFEYMTGPLREWASPWYYCGVMAPGKGMTTMGEVFRVLDALGLFPPSEGIPNPSSKED